MPININSLKNIVILFCLNNSYGCFHATTIELSNWGRNSYGIESRILTIWLFTEEVCWPLLKSVPLCDCATVLSILFLKNLWTVSGIDYYKYVLRNSRTCLLWAYIHLGVELLGMRYVYIQFYSCCWAVFQYFLSVHSYQRCMKIPVSFFLSNFWYFSSSCPPPHLLLVFIVACGLL